MSKEVQLLKDHLQEREREFHQELLQKEIKEKEQMKQDHHQLILREKEQQERMQQLQTNQAKLTLQLQEANTLLHQAEESKEELHKNLKGERQLVSSLMKHGRKQVAASEKDEMIKLLKTKLDNEKKEEKKIREELHKEIKSLQQQSQQVKDHEEVGVQFDYLVPQSGILVYM